MEDFSAWLGQTAAEGDDVVVTMDLGAGREFQLLSRMVRDGSIALVDKLYVRWHYQISVRTLTQGNVPGSCLEVAALTGPECMQSLSGKIAMLCTCGLTGLHARSLTVCCCLAELALGERLRIHLFHLRDISGVPQRSTVISL